MFPKLSQKAWAEIFDPPHNNVHFGIQNFMDLFDLEKYPITKDMIFEYLLDTDFDILSGSNAKDFEAGYETEHEYIIITDCTPIPIAIDDISCVLQKDQIIIIGEIHGWWEKGEQK